MVSTLMKHLFNNEKLIVLLGGGNVYYLEKPLKFNPDVFILAKDKLLSDRYIKQYQLQFDIIGKDLNKILEVEKELIKYLNDVRGEVIIKYDGEIIRNIRVLNGGGTIKDANDNWIKVVYFLCKV